MNDSTYAIELIGFRKRYGNVWAVNGIDLAIKHGTFFGFVGPNGAGKSTTINAMVGLISPSGGTVKIEGFDVTKQPLEVKSRVGIMLEEPVLYQRLTGREYLKFVGETYGMPPEKIKDRSKFLMELMTLDGNRFMGAYSLGMKKKAALAAALIHEPPVIILDEPFSGVDAHQRQPNPESLGTTVWLAGTYSILLLPACPGEPSSACSTEIGVIHEGKLLASGTLDSVRSAGIVIADLDAGGGFLEAGRCRGGGWGMSDVIRLTRWKTSSLGVCTRETRSRHSKRSFSLFFSCFG